MNSWMKPVIAALVLIMAAGCSRPIMKEHALPSKTKDQYTKIKRVAIFPFENYSDTKDADKMVDALLVPSLRDEEVFDEIEDTRFVRDAMKKLKITATDILDKEVVKKLADEMNVQGIVYGKIVFFGKGKDKDSAPQVTMDMSLIDPSTGAVLWVGNVTAYGSLTVGKVFGVTEGKTDIEVARDAIRRLTGAIGSEVEDARSRERKGLIAETRREEEKERARLMQLKGETGKIQAELDKAKSDAAGIRDAASKEAEAAKADLELQKAAVEAEKAKTGTAQQAIEQDKLKVEMERKKIEEDLKKIEDERKKLEAERKAAEEAQKKAVKEEAVPAPAPAAAPPAAEPAPAPAPAAPQQ